MKSKDPKEFIKKSMNKINGIVFEISDINDNMINLVISKKKRYVRFIAYGDAASMIKENFRPKSRIKIRFYAVSKKFKERWYTDLVVYETSEWRKNEKKILQQQAQLKLMEETVYKKPKFDWEDEMNKFNNASNPQSE